MEKTGYPIRAVSRLTGLSVDTLRAWERRYNAIIPDRSGRGRNYSEDDIRRLNLLREAVGQGHAIGQIASLSDKELRELGDRSQALAARPQKFGKRAEPVVQLDLDGVLSAIDRFDYVAAEREMQRLALLASPDELINAAIIPLMREVGERWYRDKLTIAQEHMISSILRGLLGSMVRIYARGGAGTTLLFATPSGEQHEFGILCAAMLAAGGGLGVVYLGASLPAQEIVNAAQRTSAQVVVLGLKGAAASKESLQELKRVARDLPGHIDIWVGGAVSEDVIERIKQTRAAYIKDFASLQERLARLGARF
jgi:DNA-binding transcriptional MerR regulator/methylmalonyl-CoA mutase cobalamin-binding subunit